MTPLPSPLSDLLKEINDAAAGGFPLLAVTMTVALPDICVSLISPDGRSTGDRYKRWCEDNLSGEEFGFVTSDDLWSMRCGVLHNGRFGDLKHNVARVVFVLPKQGTIENCLGNDTYFYSVVSFCRNFTKAVHDWYNKNSGNWEINSNLPRLMQYRTTSLAPLVAAPMKVIA